MPGSGEGAGALTGNLVQGPRAFANNELLCGWGKQFCWAVAGKGVPCTLLTGSCGSPGLELQAFPSYLQFVD